MTMDDVAISIAEGISTQSLVANIDPLARAVERTAPRDVPVIILCGIVLHILRIMGFMMTPPPTPIILPKSPAIIPMPGEYNLAFLNVDRFVPALVE